MQKNLFFYLLFLGMIVSCNSTKLPSSEAFQDITKLEFAEKMKNNNLIVLDVRTPEEFQEGHIEGAINVDFLDDEWLKKMSQLDKNKGYLIYCRSGRRSSSAMKDMQEAGFVWVNNLIGGYKGWTK